MIPNPFRISWKIDEREASERQGAETVAHAWRKGATFEAIPRQRGPKATHLTLRGGQIRKSIEQMMRKVSRHEPKMNVENCGVVAVWWKGDFVKMLVLVRENHTFQSSEQVRIEPKSGEEQKRSDLRGNKT